jgi:Fur family ferric uptake transcriptional regulator
MTIFKEKEIFNNFIRQAGLKQTAQRQKILDTFLACEEHITPEYLYQILHQQDPQIGYITVYRTLKLLTRCGLAQEVRLENKNIGFEHRLNHKHHDHMVCLGCGKIIEFLNPQLERLQEQISKEHGFLAHNHRLEIQGWCSACQEKVNPSEIP